MDDTRRGTHVIVRTFSGNKVARVWEETAQAVYVHDEVNYQRRLDGLTSLMAVGFPREDVYVYDADALAEDALLQPFDARREEG